jgi:hypothetical protein
MQEQTNERLKSSRDKHRLSKKIDGDRAMGLFSAVTNTITTTAAVVGAAAQPLTSTAPVQAVTTAVTAPVTTTVQAAPSSSLTSAIVTSVNYVLGTSSTASTAPAPTPTPTPAPAPAPAPAATPSKAAEVSSEPKGVEHSKLTEKDLHALDWTGASTNLFDLVKETEGRNRSYITMVLSKSEGKEVFNKAVDAFEQSSENSMMDFHHLVAQIYGGDAYQNIQAMNGNNVVAPNATPDQATASSSSSQASANAAVLKAQSSYKENTFSRVA